MTTPNSANQQQEHAMDVLGQRVAKRLDEGLDNIHPDISARLRFAREQALVVRRGAVLEMLPTTARVGAKTLVLAGENGNEVPRGSGDLGKTRGIFIFLLVMSLLAAFVGVEHTTRTEFEKEILEVDSALLIDALPPAAYTDPGFAQYLRTQEKD